MPSCRSRLWYFLSPLDGASVRDAHCAQASNAVRCTEAPCAQDSTAVRFSARSALRAGYWPTCLTDGHMVVNDHTRSAENWKCVWYFLRPIAVRARSAATRLFGRWHHNTDWQLHARAKRAPSESFNGKLSMKGYFTIRQTTQTVLSHTYISIII